ncbi:hypothetical protein D5086_012883 [Populus alba]|uniref:Uncharacterized protein n=1 Tax=Populus alba TaxID=43335 RepID=A0ACC4C4H6_POPAL
MGNISSRNNVNNRRSLGSRRSHPPPPTPAPPQPEITANRYVFAAATPYPSQYPNPNPPRYYQHPGYYPAQPTAMPVPLPAPYDHHHRVDHPAAHWVGGSITIIFFAKEGEDCILTPTKAYLLPPVTVNFQQGLGQKFRQPSGTGIDFTLFEEKELVKQVKMDAYPLAVKAEASPANQKGTEGNQMSGAMNSQITHAVFEKEKGEYQVRVMKQILWVNGMRYELQEIYGIGNSVDGDVDANDPGKECVICLSEPRDTTVLPCRHMCMCSGCAKVLRFQTNRCPICRQPVDRLLEIKVNNGPDE